MATAFLKLLSSHIFDTYKDNTEKLCIVLPNKRAGLFLKQHLAQTYGKTIWLPKIIGAEEFFTELSGLKVLEEIDLICYLFESYRVCYGAEAEPFDSFTKWGQLILQDFNEIDRYLADSEKLYENLKDIKEIENWSLGAEELSEYQTKYLKFMKSLGAIYKHFNAFLLKNKWAYQGSMYKHALANSSTYQAVFPYNTILFSGFNALNAAELKIIQHLYRERSAQLIWDTDAYYLDDPEQEAGLFLRKNFELFPESKYLFKGNYFKETKNIRIVSVPKQIGQAQVVKQSLQRLINAGVPLDKVAIVLANEKLLWPVLHQLPAEVEHVNITMEYPIKYTSAYSLLDSLLDLQVTYSKQKRQHKTLYHKELIQLLREPLFLHYLHSISVKTDIHTIIHQIQKRNLSFINSSLLKELFHEELDLLAPLLKEAASIPDYCKSILQLITALITYFSETKNNLHRKLELEYLQVILNNYNRLYELVLTYPLFNDLSSYKQLFQHVIGTGSVPFIGEPLKGLQIMGILESRTLDFDHVILVNANEGILPSGKSINSFIPNDLKRAFGLPLYLEKDAIYAYHFYRLIQRASDVVITFDSETDTFGKGEKSRFVTQLVLELKNYSPETVITEEVASYAHLVADVEQSICIQKNETVLKSIIEKAKSNEAYGALSPSSLISFKECSLRFYFRYGVHLKENESVEETAEANTFGSILHISLEHLYSDLITTTLKKEILQAKLDLVNSVVHQSFISFFDQKELQGKSILQEEVIKVYVNKLVKQDVLEVEKLNENKQQLTLLHLEQEFSTPLIVKMNGQKITIYFKGKIDRIDRFADTVRVVDYKTTVKLSDQFKFEGFDPLFKDPNYNKQFQLFLYAWLLYKNDFCAPEALRPCIIAFKDFKSEPNFIRENKNILRFNAQLLEEFEVVLISFIEKIVDERYPFEQTEDQDLCTYCAYTSICKRVQDN